MQGENTRKIFFTKENIFWQLGPYNTLRECDMYMAEFEKWISYLYAYSGEVKGKNVGFVRVEVRGGRCRLSLGIKGAYGCDTKGLQVAMYQRQDGMPRQIPIGHMKIREGSGEFEQVTSKGDLFGTGVDLKDIGGLWLTCEGRNTIYLASWEKTCLDIGDFLKEAPQENGQNVATAQSLQTEIPKTLSQEIAVPPPSLWESLCRYYPKVAPHLRQQGIELLQIRPADIRYLPRGLWYYGSNSFLLHGYYHYKYLVLGRIHSEEGQQYLLGVPGVREERERFSAQMFGFGQFLPLQGQQGYWYTQIHL